MKTLLGVDTGGTFTDFVAVDPSTGRLEVVKTRTTPSDPSDAVIEGVRALAERHEQPLAAVATLVHATTLVTNALVERKGARVGLIVTDGFRDVLGMRNEQRYDVYDLFLEFPPPLVPRELTMEVRERLTRDGDLLVPVAGEDVAAAVEALKADGVEVVAVCLLHSYANPAHEREVRELIEQHWSNGNGPVPTSLSSDVMPQIDEYERASVTVANAYVQPLADGYLRRSEARLREAGLTGNFFVMLSNGGISASETARRFPVRMVESGPAAGVLCAARYGRDSQTANLISFDMGGTTAKIGVVDAGEPIMSPGFEVARVHRFKRGSGLPLRVPAVDIIEIGAGGGSIARINEAELLEVGPESASADPGPACYGSGGTDATVTDANVVLGILSPDFVLGGEMPLDVNAAEEAVRRHVGEPLGITATEAAWGIHTTVNQNMIGALQVHLAERGKDPESYTLMAFGGCGPAHAVSVARALRIPEVLVPFGAGVASALGAALAPPAFDFAHSYVSSLDDVDWAGLEDTYRRLADSAVAVLKKAGVEPSDIEFRRSADMRYEGQVYDIEVPLRERLDAASKGEIEARFDREYSRRYSRLYPDSAVQITTCRLKAAGPPPDIDLHALVERRRFATATSEAVKGTRRIWESPLGWVEAAVYDRYALGPGASIEGPAVVEEREATAVLWTGDTATVDELVNLRVSVHRPERD